MSQYEQCGSHLDQYTYERLLGEALAQVPDTLDKRQGSIIFDTLAVGDVQLAQAYIQLKGYYHDAYALTARGAYLELKAEEAGVSRLSATRAVKLGTFTTGTGEPASIPMEARFSTAQSDTPLIYRVTAVHTEGGVTVPGSYQLACETAGTKGNDYTGSLIPVTHINGLSTAVLGETLIPARDEEDDESLRARYLEAVNRPAFGGNVAQYRQWITEMEGVGAVQIYPVWDGGGTVKASIIGSDHNPASATLLEEIQDALDPERSQGTGLGLAPIGHVVTVTTPEKVEVDVEATLTLSGATLDQVREEIGERIASYLLELRKQFGTSGDGNAYSVHVYRARIAAAMILVPGVDNVTDVRLNGADADLELEETALNQQLPLDGTVTLHEA